MNAVVRLFNISRLFFPSILLILSDVLYGQWVIQNSNTLLDLYSVSFADSLNGWVVGDSGVILHTNDGGDEWTQQESGESLPLLSVSFCDLEYGWAVGMGGTILRTSNGGSNWVRVIHDTSSTIRHFKVQCLTMSTTIVLRDSLEDDFYTNYRLWRTDDSGTSWLEISPHSGFYNAIRDMYFVSASHGWACGFGGTYLDGYQIHRTTDGGFTWITDHFNAPTLWSMQKIYFESELEGWATDWDTLFHTLDGGATWDRDRLPGFNDLSDFVMFGEIGYASRMFGRIMKTKNSGFSWFEQSSSPVDFIEDLEFTSPEEGWAVGWNGVIAHTVNGGLTIVKEDESQFLLPQQFLLKQNYPNPFNPTTTIEFSMQNSGLVTLNVYDVLGREAGTILNQWMDAGNHKIQWNAQRIPTGIYFITMVSGEFRQTQKALLMK